MVGPGNVGAATASTVGSSTTITPWGILLTILGTLGIVGLIAALLDYFGVDIQKYIDMVW